jgi:GNAT superfamily N-acetyltransferase
MDDFLTDPAPAKIVAAMEENLIQAVGFFFGGNTNDPRTQLHNDPDMLWTLTDIPFPLFNAVCGARLPENSVDERIKTVLDRYREGNVPMIWWTGPATQPPDLGNRLQAHGLMHSDDLPGMAVDLHHLSDHRPPPTTCTIQQVDNAEALQTWCRVCIAGFDMPDFAGNALYDLLIHKGFSPDLPSRNYLAMVDGQPVATTSVYVGAGVAGIYNVATLPHARRQGVATALILRALTDAHTLGYRIATLQSSPMGLGIYQQVGFREYCTISTYMWQPTPQEGESAA